MIPRQTTIAVPGWIGGFAQSNPAFAYPDVDLSSLDIYDNLDHIDLLQRQQKVIWPEFSWETQQGKPDPKRCFQMFAPDISRIGYTDTGRVYSIICPQQGATSPTMGSMNVEVTVTGQRGWVDESNRTLAADMSVEGKIWFSPSAQQEPLVKLLWDKFANSKLPFPSDKSNAIRIRTHLPGKPEQVLFPLKTGETKEFEVPAFAKHPEAWGVGNLSVQMGSIIKTGSKVVDDFNELVLGIFNTASGNMLKSGNILTWNVWFTAPEYVDTEEWSTHAEKWRKSINADHGSPEGEGTDARYFDGTPFNAAELFAEDLPRSRGLDDEPIDAAKALEKQEIEEIESYLARKF
jgi:hypothetical protein